MSGKIAFITMGCAKNEVDSSKMADALSACGFSVIEDASAADMVVVNTCSFIQQATEESIAAVLDAASLPNIEAGAKLVVAGCMPARYGEDLEAEFPEVAAFVPCASEGGIAEIAVKLLGSSPSQSRLAGDSIEAEEARAVRSYDEALEVEDPRFAYIKISDGCDRWCSYCTIPKIRGRYHSFPKQRIFDDVAEQVRRGAREAVLIAQDTGRWGSDLEGEGSLADLLAELAESFPDTRFRVMYIQPEGVSDELLDAIAAHDNICDYLDIPIQHVVPRILRDMNRKGSAEEYAVLFDRIMEKLPDVSLRTTLIAGFPGETEDDARALEDFIESSPFDHIGVFPYSREEGTKAHDLPDQIDEVEKAQRAQRLRDIADAVCAANISRRIGSAASVLVEGREADGQLYGRSEWQAPEVDGITFVDSGEMGGFVPVSIEDTLFYDMEGSSI